MPIEPRYDDPDDDCICLDTIIRLLNRAAKNLLNIIILDACRADDENRAWKAKAVSSEEALHPAFGKALKHCNRLPTESQFALIYSSDPGTVSFAGDPGENSFFTSALLNHLSKPNSTLDNMMREVTKEILEKSSKKQRPWLYSCLVEAFYFNHSK